MAREGDAPHQRGQCGKRCYPSKQAARRAHGRAGFRLRTYWCHLCRGWHVANQDKRDR